MATVAERLTKVNIGLSTEQCEGVVKLLNTFLCDEFVLYTKTKNYHWNIRGWQFEEFHNYFKHQYEKLDEITDKLAERCRAMGGKAWGTLTEFCQNSRIKEHPGTYPTTKEMVKNLLNDHEAIIRYFRTEIENCNNKYHDWGTGQLLSECIEKHEELAWTLRAYCEEE